ncbi:MAG: TonB-dependent receptor [Saprospiraceae bacterium]
MKKYIVFVVSFLCSLMTFAQTMIKGKVVDQNTQIALEGADISSGSGTGTTSGRNGEFMLECTGSSITLEITYVGYEPAKRTLNCNSEEPVIIALFPSMHNLGEVEVTASALPKNALAEQYRPIATLDKIDLNRGTGLFLDDAINSNIPGVSMERRTHSAGQQINIRGYGNGIGFRGANNNFDMQGLKAYINGIPITDAEGVTAMDDIDFGSLSNVQVLKGPAGTLYGLAIAGVVNLQTQKAPKNSFTLGQDVMAGSYGLLRTTTRLAIGGNRSSLLVNYGHQNFDGFMVHTASHKDFVNVMGDFDLNSRQSLTTYFGYSDSYDERNGELTIDQYESFDYSGNGRYIANNAHSAVRTYRAGVGHTYTFNNRIANTTSFFGSGQSLDNSSAGGWTDKYPLNYGLRSVFNTNFELNNNLRLTGITGLELQKMNAQTIGYGMGADSTNPGGYNIITSLRSDQATTNSTASYFTQWTLHLPSDFRINAGIGISSMSIRLDDRLWALSNNHPGNKTLQSYQTSYSGLVSPNLTLQKSFGEAAELYASYSVGYKAPVSSNVLIATTGQLNTGLKPERGAQIEIGSTGRLMDNRMYYSIALFQANFMDKFTTQTVQNPDNTATLYSYIVNGGKLDNKGLEVLIRYDLVTPGNGFMQMLRPFANLTYSDFNYKDFTFERIGKDANGKDMTIVDDYSGNAVAGIAPVVFNAGLDAVTESGFYGNLNFHYQSEMPYTSDGENKANAYGLLNGKIGFRKSMQKWDLDLYAGVQNITGTQYFYMVFVNQLPDAYIPASQDINFFGGIGLNYHF